MADQLLKEAFQNGASDIHVIPKSSEYFVQIRKVGTILPQRKIPYEEGERLISHYKFKASMDIGERRKPQSGSYSIQYKHQTLSLRISTLPTSHAKESLVIRILPQRTSVPLHQLSLYPSSVNKLLSLLLHAHGLLLFTGPTGSGKSTTLYTLVHYCSQYLKRNVITLEDPVEKQDDGLLQVQVNEKAGITYSTGLRAILRHDPDIIMIGEIRDKETAEIAVQAALSGHLVLSTLHSRDAKGSIYRLLELGIQWHELQQTIVGVTAQRLVRLYCPICGEECNENCIIDSIKKRASVYEILSGENLAIALKEAKGEEVSSRYKKIKDFLKKGVALGFISEKEYKKWIHEE